MGEVDEVHQPQRDRKAAGEHEQQHAIGNAVEQNCEQRGHPVRALMLRRPEGPSRSTRASFNGSQSFETPAQEAGSSRMRPTSLRHWSLFGLARVFDGLKSLEFDVVKLAI